jgi:hypothetical protein
VKDGADVSWIKVLGDVVKELWSGGSCEDGFMECDFDVVDPIVGENLLAAHGRNLSIVVGESPGHYTHPKEEGTGLFLSDFGKAYRVNNRSIVVHLRLMESKCW